jgi:hypothetical protein
MSTAGQTPNAERAGNRGKPSQTAHFPLLRGTNRWERWDPTRVVSASLEAINHTHPPQSWKQVLHCFGDVTGTGDRSVGRSLLESWSSKTPSQRRLQNIIQRNDDSAESVILCVQIVCLTRCICCSISFCLVVLHGSYE